jgi:hypothetical protein
LKRDPPVPILEISDTEPACRCTAAAGPSRAETVAGSERTLQLRQAETASPPSTPPLQTRPPPNPALFSPSTRPACAYLAEPASQARRPRPERRRASHRVRLLRRGSWTAVAVDRQVDRSMEMKMSGSGEASPGANGSAECKKRPPSRLQKHAPASLQLEQGAAAGAGGGPDTAWGEGRTPIPLLSPLVVSPTPTTPVWEADQAVAGVRREEGDAEGMGCGGEQLLRGAAARHSGIGERQPHDAPVTGVGWRHPALPTPLAEPASLLPLFQSQCALEARGAQQ